MIPRAGGTQAEKPGLGVGCSDLVNDLGGYSVTMVISMDSNHDGWMDGWMEWGTAGGCNPAFPRTMLHRKAHQILLCSHHGEAGGEPGADV